MVPSAPGPHSWDLPGAGSGQGGRGMCGLGGWARLDCWQRWVVAGDGCQKQTGPPSSCPAPSPHRRAPSFRPCKPRTGCSSSLGTGWSPGYGRFGGAGMRIPARCLGRGWQQPRPGLSHDTGATVADARCLSLQVGSSRQVSAGIAPVPCTACLTPGTTGMNPVHPAFSSAPTGASAPRGGSPFPEGFHPWRP